MIDRANHWFYAERQLTPGATVEKMRQNLWSYGFYNIWLTLTKKEPPYVLSGLWGTDKFEIEFEPRKFLIIRLAKDNEWLKTAFTSVSRSKSKSARALSEIFVPVRIRVSPVSGSR